MFFFRKKKIADTDLSWLQTDIHSHLIPGIDDGSDTMETSLTLIRGLKELGYRKIITTPHILSDIYPNTHAVIQDGCIKVRQALKDQQVQIEFNAAAEYFIDEQFEQKLREKIPLLVLKDKLVLVEISMVTAPFDLKSILFEMQLQNYIPVIAHPERYIYLSRKKEVFDELKDIGCYFQLNLLSLSGQYGSSVQELAAYLIKKNYYNLAGTDMHHERHLAALRELSDSVLYQRVKDSGMIRNYIL